MTTKSDLYLDTRPVDEIINSTEIIPQYEFIVNDIIRDRDYGWSLDYFKGDGTTTYDVIIARTKMEINDCMKLIVDNKLVIDKTRDLIDNNNKETGKNKKKDIDINELNKKIEEAIDNISELNNLIKKDEQLLKDYKWLQFVELNQEGHLRRIRNKFQIYGDLEYVRKGVSWICSYTEKLRGNLIDYSIKPKEDTSAW
jgi:hypothetical protein